MATQAEEARARFVAEYSAHEDAAARLKTLLEEYTREHGYRAVVEVRPKTVASFVKKAHKLDRDGALRYSDPWSEIRDKVGARVVVETLRELQGLRAAMESSGLEGSPFTDLDDKARSADPASMFYPGVHAQVIVPGVVTNAGEPIDAEVQLRTKAQDLWSSTSHKLVYKGFIQPGWATSRRVMRLSVLVEMFDEEVERAMNELAADPAYRAAEILHLAEAEYLRFIAEPGEPELSLEILGTLEALVPDDLDNYERVLRAFVAEHEGKMRDAFAAYGAYSVFAESYAYWLFSQPEAVVVFHLIDAQPQALVQILPDELLEPVRHLFAAWGREMPNTG